MKAAIDTRDLASEMSERLEPGRAHYLRLVWMLVRRELKVKYRGTFLGYLWSMLNPLLFMVILSIVFSHLMKGVAHYSIFVLSGILLWNVVGQAILGGTGSIVGNAGLIRKVRVPIWVFPLVPLGSAFVNLGLALIPFAIIYAVQGLPLPNDLYALPLVIGLLALFLCGISLTLSCLNVFFRDVSHVLEPILQLIFYATPIIYDRTGTSIPPKISSLLLFNPFTHFVESFRATTFPGRNISPQSLIVMVVASGISLGIGCLVYQKSKAKITFRL